MPTTPFADQAPGTSGLRKPVSAFLQANYLENFVQSIFDGAGLSRDAALVVGGDGRYHTHRDPARRKDGATRMAFAPFSWGRAVSCLIRKRAAAGGILLTASHNPGGPSGDFGVKVDVANGGPAPEGVTEAIFVASRRIARYRTLEAEDIDLDRLGPTRLGPAAVEVFDPVADYADLMETLFDFGAISWLFPAAGFRMRYDAMHAVNGPYAHELLARRLFWLKYPGGPRRRRGSDPAIALAAIWPPLLTATRLRGLGPSKGRRADGGPAAAPAGSRRPRHRRPTHQPGRRLLLLRPHRPHRLRA